MLHWISEHQAVFEDVALLWVAPVLLISIVARLFRQNLRADADYLRVTVEPGDDHDAETDRSFPAT